MRTLIFLAVITVALCLPGCAQVPDVLWVKPGASRADVNREAARCARAAMRESDCMQMRGYRREAEWQ